MKIGSKVLVMGTKIDQPSDYIGVVVAEISGATDFKIIKFDENQPFMHDATHLSLVLDDGSVYVPSGDNYYAIEDSDCKILGEI